MQVSYLFVGNKIVPIGTKEFIYDYAQYEGYYFLQYGGLKIMASHDAEVLSEFVEWVVGFWTLNYKAIKASEFKPKGPNSGKTFFYI